MINSDWAKAILARWVQKFKAAALSCTWGLRSQTEKSVRCIGRAHSERTGVTPALIPNCQSRLRAWHSGQICCKGSPRRARNSDSAAISSKLPMHMIFAASPSVSIGKPRRILPRDCLACSFDGTGDGVQDDKARCKLRRSLMPKPAQHKRARSQQLYFKTHRTSAKTIPGTPQLSESLP